MSPLASIRPNDRSVSPPFVHRYLPMMKTKAGEVTALENLSPVARSRIVPLFHVCEDVKASFVPGLATAWSGMLTIVDGSFNHRHTGNSQALHVLVNAMRNSGIPTMPCWSQSDRLDHQYAARAIVDGYGAAVKSSLTELASLDGWLYQQNLPLASVDLIVDLKHIAASRLVPMQDTSVRFLINSGRCYPDSEA
jgi:hypothetical protein